MKFIKTIVWLLLSVTISSAQVSVLGRVNHIKPDGVSTTGGITLNVSGSTAPYTYTWNPGAINTKDITGKTAGQYTVNVKSASSQSYTASYKIGYKTMWTNLNSVKLRNDSLTPDVPSGFFGSAISKNTLAANKNGWFEYVLNYVGVQNCYIGFTDSVSPLFSSVTDIDFGIWFRGATLGLYSYRNGSTTLLTSSPKVGDVIRVERRSDSIIYRVNSTVVSTTVTNVSQKTFKLKAALNGGHNFVNVGCSFNKMDSTSFINYVNVIPIIRHCSKYGVNDGSIKITPKIPFTNTYSWSPGGATTSSVTSLAFGSYTATVKDSLMNQSIFKYDLGYKVLWTNINRGYFRNDSLVSTSAGANVFSTAHSKNILAANTDGWVQYVINAITDNDTYIGFSDSLSANQSAVTDIDYGLFLYAAAKSFNSYENGTTTLLNGTPSVGDIVRIERVGNTISYLVNGLKLRTITVSGIGQKALKLKVNLESGTKIINVGCSFIKQDSSAIKNYVKVIPLIKHSSRPGVNDGSVKITPLVPFSNTYSWSPSGASTGSISALGYGTYTINIKDSLMNQSTYKLNVGYKVLWANLDRCSVSNDSLKSNAVSAVLSSACSKNTLKHGKDGWVEYTISALGSYDYYIGFADSLSPISGNYKEIDYGIYYNSSNKGLYSCEGGSLTIIHASPQVGDVIRLERVSNSIRYKFNDVNLGTTTVSGLSAKNLKITAHIEYTDKLINIGCSFYDIDSISFKNYLFLDPTIKHCSGQGIYNGSISLSQTAYSYSWEPSGATTSTIGSLTAGTVSANVTDSLFNQTSYSYNVGYKALWTNTVTASLKNDSLKGTGSVTTYGYGCTKNILSANKNGWFEYVIKYMGSYGYYVGFTDSVSNNSSIITDINFGIYYNSSNKCLYSYEGGTTTLILPSVKVGDVIRVERAGNTIYYKANGVIARTITNSATGAKILKLKAKLLYQSYLTNVGCSFGINNNTITGSVTNVVNDTIPGQFIIILNNGLPYNIAWNNIKMGTASKVYNDLLLQMPGLTGDSVQLKKSIDSLRLQRKMLNVEAGFYKATVYNYIADSLNAVGFVSTKVNWLLTSGVTTTTTPVPFRKIRNTSYFYGNGESLIQPGTNLNQSIAVAANRIIKSEDSYIQFSIPNSLDTLTAGLEVRKAYQDSLVADSVVKARFEFIGNNRFRVRAAGASVFNGTYSSGAVFAIATDATTKIVSFYRNDTVIKQSKLSDLFAVVDSAADNAFAFKVFMKGLGSRLSNLVMKTPNIANRLTANIKDVSCGNTCSGLIDAYGSTGITSVPNRYELYNASNTLISTVYYYSGMSHALFPNLCAGTYKVTYYATVQPPYLIGSHPPAPYSIFFSKQFEVGYLPEWQNAYNVSVTPPYNSLQKNTFSGTGYGGAFSENILKPATSAWMEFSFPQTSASAVFGLSTTDPNTNGTSVNYGIFYWNIPPYVSLGAVVNNGNILGPTFFMINTASKFRIEKNSGTIKLYHNSAQVGSYSASTTDNFYADATLDLSSLIYRPRMSFGCPFLSHNYYSLKNTMDGGYYNLINNKLNFKYIEEYASIPLNYNIYDSGNAIVASNLFGSGIVSPGMTVPGDNRFVLDFSSSSFGQGYYTLEVINSKKEKQYLRFKK